MINGVRQAFGLRSSAGVVCCWLFGVLLSLPGFAQAPGQAFIEVLKAVEHIAGPKDMPARGDEGMGPFSGLLIKDVVIIDGTGAPAYGPASVLVERDRIATITLLSDPEYDEKMRAVGDDIEVIEAEGHYLLPGFVDSHAHFGSTISAGFGGLNDPEYVSKLWLGHGITTIRDVGALWGLDWYQRHKKRSDAGEITAPRIMVYPMFPGQSSKEYPGKFPVIDTVKKARNWVRAVHKKGADGVKFVLNEFETPPAIYEAAVTEAKALGMGTATHYGVFDISALDSARLGVDSIEHMDSVPFSLWRGFAKPEVPLDYRTPGPAKGPRRSLWDGAYSRGSVQWQQLIDGLVREDHVLVPTLTIMESGRDLMRTRTADWHAEFTLPSLSRAFAPNPKVHASGYLDWTTAHEVAFERQLQTSFAFIRDFHGAGGRIAAGADAGFSYQLYGFGFVRELEFLQMAGLHPLEVLKAATLTGAELIGREDDLGSIAVGKKADLVLVEENPLVNFKVLYGTGHQRFNPETGGVDRVGGVKFTIKDGVVWDAKGLLADVRNMVAMEKEKRERINKISTEP